jgi:hypothetical protein
LCCILYKISGFGTFSLTFTVNTWLIAYSFVMERQAAQRIPKWKVNARTQVHKLAKDNVINISNFMIRPLFWIINYHVVMQILGLPFPFITSLCIVYYCSSKFLFLITRAFCWRELVWKV